MRRDLTKPDVPWTVRISAADKDELVQRLPMQGAQTWLVQKSLESFLNLMEAAPQLQPFVRAQVQEMLYGDERGPRSMRDINVRIPTDLYVRFSKTFPEFGTASWFMRRFIRAFVEDLRHGITLEERVEAVVAHAVQTLPEELND